jgi:mobilome CxxCx(11)CxxC protein
MASVTADEKLAQLRVEAWDSALHMFGTGYLFERRARAPKRGLFILSFSGLVLPVVLGSYVAAFGRSAPQLERVIVVIGVIAGLQAILSVWALVAKWDDQYTVAIEGAREYNRLATGFRSLAKSPSDDAEVRFKILTAERNARESADVSQLLTDKEKRRGMRAALREFQKECVSCKQVPHSMRPTNCPVCGDF